MSRHDKDSFFTITIKSKNNIDEKDTLNSSRQIWNNRKTSTNLINVREMSKDELDFETSKQIDTNRRFLKEHSSEFSYIEKKTPLSDINDKMVIKTLVEDTMKDNMKNFKIHEHYYKHHSDYNIYNHK